jgi:chorismate-pyruvate lyase
MIMPVNKLSDHPVAGAALHDLCRPFLPAGRSFDPACAVVSPDQMPFPADQLLVHHDHMTEVLQKHHGSPVDVRVLREVWDGELYTRQIVLTPHADPGKEVEWGIVRLDFRFLSQPVKDEILAKKLPLGAVLIKHNVLRRVKPRWFIEFPEDGPTLKLFGKLPHPGPVYGRIGTIYCNGEPAIEVLEIALNA